MADHLQGRHAIVIAEVFAKTTQTTPKQAVLASQKRLRLYDKISEGEF